MGEVPKKRPWYRLHILAWVLLCCVTGSVVLENLVGQYSPSTAAFIHGWPIGFLARWNFYLVPGKTFPSLYNRWPIDNLEVFDFAYLRLLINIMIALAILLATIFTTESYLRRQPKWQISILSIILFTVFVALLMMNIKYDMLRWHGDALWEFIPFFFIAVGLWCVFWTGWRLVCVGVSRIGGGSGDG